ncbi:MAG TPA: hypothetical protein VGX96_02635 [Candidatus Elarobacter sp.]|nr:hypothetical protein [Candidatus Elarobacter sp.]
MQHLFSIIAAAGMLSNANVAATTNAPVAVSTCAVTDLYNPAILAEFGPPIPYKLLQLSFLNTDDTVATQVTFDVTHAGTHTTVIDRGRFSKGVRIEHQFYDDFADDYRSSRDTCTVAAITFADGRRWTAPVN